MSWFRGENMHEQISYSLLLRRVYEPDLMIGGIHEWVLSQSWILGIFAVLSVLLEIGAPLILVYRKLIYIWCIGNHYIFR